MVGPRLSVYTILIAPFRNDLTYLLTYCTPLSRTRLLIRDLRIVFFVRIESRIESALYHASRISVLFNYYFTVFHP